MCGIAELLINQGYEVSGSDIKDSANVKYLKKLGAVIDIGHSPENIKAPHVVVISSAVGKANNEVQAARKKDIPVIPRAEMLCELMRLKYAVCVAGTHGKTTTTSMMGLILSEAGLDPTVVVGGLFKNIESNAKPGEGSFMVAEADESDGSFLKLTPAIAIVTNIDDDHMDYYGNMEKLKKTFSSFLNKVPFYGFCVVCGDDKNIKEILNKITRPCLTYGMDASNTYSADEVSLSDEETSYTFLKKGVSRGRISIQATGMHNVLNSMAAVSAALEMDIDFETIKKALKGYRGVGRRLEKKGERAGVLFYDDYAHHPSEIKMGLGSLRKIYPEKRIIAVFQPHRYSRTRELASSFPGAFRDADEVLITEIYGAGEKEVKGIDSSLITGEFPAEAKVKYIKDMKDLKKYLEANLKKSDLCITLGAGNIDKVSEDLFRSPSG